MFLTVDGAEVGRLRLMGPRTGNRFLIMTGKTSMAQVFH